MTIHLELAGYFEFACKPCSEASACTFGCGREPKTLCEMCYTKLGLSGFLPIIGVEGESEIVCDECGDLF